jgi:hypothetical protein
MTAPVAVEDLDALLSVEIPCGDCGNPAQLRTFGHRGGDCGLPYPAPFFKCVGCYQEWVAGVTEALAWHGWIRCHACDARFTDIDDFAMYRTF